MDFQSIFARKSLPEAGFGKNVVIDADRCSGSRVMSIILTRGGLLFKTGKSDHRFKCLHLPRASVRRASGFVLTCHWRCGMEHKAIMVLSQHVLGRLLVADGGPLLP